MTTKPTIVDCQEICSQLISVVPPQTVALLVKGAKFLDILKALESGDRVYQKRRSEVLWRVSLTDLVDKNPSTRACYRPNVVIPG